MAKIKRTTKGKLQQKYETAFTKLFMNCGNSNANPDFIDLLRAKIEIWTRLHLYRKFDVDGRISEKLEKLKNARRRLINEFEEALCLGDMEENRLTVIDTDIIDIFVCAVGQFVDKKTGKAIDASSKFSEETREIEDNMILGAIQKRINMLNGMLRQKEQVENLQTRKALLHSIQGNKEE
jgi:hypothetical protein